MDKALQRFLDYIRIDTQSDDQSESIPSTAKQLNLAKRLAEDLKNLGIAAEIDEFGIVYASLPGKEGLDPIGLNSHMDTALECSGKDVKPHIIENYHGGTIVLGHGYSMSPKTFPNLSNRVGHDLVVTSGDTLLGADDKAGLAIIMAVLDHFVSHPEIPHHPIRVCFTPDEEIGRGPDHVDIKKFGAKFAFTVDGSSPEEFSYETFNAAHAEVIIKGVSIHPGDAKGKLVNASTVAFAFDRALPEKQRPEFTCGREGFNHLVGVMGSVDEAKMHYIIRNHDKNLLESQKKDFEKAKAVVEKAFPGCKVELKIENDYRNMREVIDQHPEVLETAFKGYKRVGIEPKIDPIRGGTDGAGFSFMGCPCPNLGTGSYNHHGRFEYLDVNEFHQMIDLVVAILSE